VFPLRSVGQPVGWRADPKVTRHLSSGYPASQSILSVGCTGYLVRRSLRSVLRAPEVFQPTPSPPSSEGGSSSHRLQTPFRDPNWCRLVASRRRTVVLAPGSSHEVLRPYSGWGEVSRHCSAPPEHHPSSAFLRPLRVFSSPNLAALFHAAAALGVVALQSFFLLANPAGFITRRAPPDVSQVNRRRPAAPSGDYVSQQFVPGFGVLHP